MPARKRPPSATSRTYRVGEIAAMFDVSIRTIWKWVATGQLPEPIRKGHWTGWPREQIDAIVPPPPPAEAAA